MKLLDSVANGLLARFSPYRLYLLIASMAVAALLGYIIIKFPAHNDIYALAGNYSQRGLPEAVTTSWANAQVKLSYSLVGLTYAELAIDTLLFIPFYALTLLLWAGYYAKQSPIASHSYWLTIALRWLWPRLLLLIGVAAVSNLVENVCLTSWVVLNHPPVSETAMTVIRLLKLVPIGVVSSYVLVGFLMSEPFLLFLKKIGRNGWYVFKLVALNKFIRCGVTILRTIWPIALVLLLTYLFLNLMDQARDLLDALVHDPKYSVCVFACLLLYGLVVWYSTRIIFILKDQRHLVERVNDSDTDHKELLKMVAFKKETDTWMETLPIHAAIDSKTLRAFTRWTPVVLGATPFFSLMAAMGQLEETSWHQLALVIEVFVYVAIVHQVKNYVAGPTADDCNIHPHSIDDLLPVHRHVLRLALAGVYCWWYWPRYG